MNFMKINRGKCKVLNLARNNAHALIQTGVLMDNKLPMSQPCTLLFGRQDTVSLLCCKGTK